MPSILHSDEVLIRPRPLTSSSFRPYGSVIENSAKDISAGSENASRHLPENASIANQGSAIKFSNVSQMETRYHRAASGAPARPAVSMFVCEPRRLRPVDSIISAFDVKILERHPYTTQTFIPMGLSATDPATRFLIIVAPTLRQPGGGPDLTKIEAFIAAGDQAVTYGAGTWHAPMVVLGAKPIEFVVYQFVNGVADDDCQEVVIKGLGTKACGPSVMLEYSPNSGVPPKL